MKEFLNVCTEERHEKKLNCFDYVNANEGLLHEHKLLIE